VSGQARVQPRLADVRRVDGEALAQGETGCRGAGGEFADVWPGPLRVDVVGGDGRYAAPVIDASPEHESVLGVDQVGRRLDTHPRAEDELGDRDGRGEVVKLRVRHVAHRGMRLGPEVLDDDLLDAVVGAGDLADGERAVVR
jgi:hypothetical protein